MKKLVGSPSWHTATAVVAACGTSVLLAPWTAHAEEKQETVATAESAPEEAHELDAIVVEGKLIESPAKAPSTAVGVNEEELEKFEEDDVHQVLLKVPGVQVVGEDGLGLRPNIGIRGTSPNRSTKVALMEDGVLLGPAPYSAPAAYYFPQVTRMTAVEVHKGGSQMLYGPRALGGAINLVTPEIPQGWGGYADVELGEYDYAKLHGRGGYGAENTGFLLEAIHVQSSGFKELDGGGGTGFDKNEVMAKWRLQSSPSAEVFQRFDLKMGLATERSDETYLGLTDSDFEKSPYRRYVASSLDQMNWHRGQAQATYSVLPSDDLELSFTAYRNQFTRDWFKVDGLGGASLDEVLQNPTSPVNATYYEVLTGQASSESPDQQLLLADNYRWYISEGLQTAATIYAESGPVEHELVGGARFHYDEVNRIHTQHTYNMVVSDMDSLGKLESSDTPPEVTVENRGQTHALALHVVDTLSVTNFTFTPGARLEFVWTKHSDALDPSLDNTRTQIGVIPGMGVHYALTPELGFLAGGYRGFGPATPQALPTEGELPKAETSTTWEAGSRYAAERTHAEAVGYIVQYGNLTADCSQSSGCSADQAGTQFDGGKVSVWGLESLLAHEWLLGKFEVPARATYSLTMSAFRTAFSSANPEWGDVEVGDELPYLPKHQGSFGLGIGQKKNWAVDGNMTLVAAAREVAGSGELEDEESTDAYALLGLAGKVRAFGQLWFYARGSNLLDSAYLTSRRPHGARPGAPRWIHVGFKIEH